MVIEIIAVAGALAVGFGLGRIKNKTKLASVSTLLNNEEAKASADAKSLIAKVRAAL